MPPSWTLRSPVDADVSLEAIDLGGACMRNAWLYSTTKNDTRDIGHALVELGYSPSHVAPDGRGAGRAPELAVVVASAGGALDVELLDRLRRDEELAGAPVLLAVDRSHLHTASALALADELLVQPFSLDELRARIGRATREARVSPDDDLVGVGTLVLNLATYDVTVEGQSVGFPYMEFELLKFLATHPNRVFSREALLARVWGYDYYGGERTVDVHVRRVRARLGEPNAARLKTVRSVGYLLDARQPQLTAA
jgi:DNA-binding response OmpR family regulator